MGHGVKMNNKTKILLVAILAFSAVTMISAFDEVDEAYAMDENTELIEANNEVSEDYFYIALGAVMLLAIIVLTMYRRKVKF